MGPHVEKRHAEGKNPGHKWHINDEEDLYTLLQQQRPASSSETIPQAKSSQKKEILASHVLLGLLHIAQGETLRPEEEKLLDTNKQKELQRLWLLWPDAGNDIRTDLTNLETAYNILQNEKKTVEKRSSKTEQTPTELRSIRKELEDLTRELHLPHLDLYSSELRSLQNHWTLEARRRALHPAYHSDSTELERLQQLIWIHKEIAHNNDEARRQRLETTKATYHLLSHTNISKSIKLLSSNEYPSATFLREVKLSAEQWQKIQSWWSSPRKSKSEILQEEDFAHIYQITVNKETDFFAIQKNEKLIQDFFVPENELSTLITSFESSTGNAQAEMLGLSQNQYDKLKKNWTTNQKLSFRERREALAQMALIFIFQLRAPDASFIVAAKKTTADQTILLDQQKPSSKEKPVLDAKEVAKDFLTAIAELKEFNKRFKTDSPTKPWDFSLQDNTERLALLDLAMTGKTQLLNAAELQLTPSDIRVLQDTCTGFSELSLSSRDFKNSSDQCIKLLETVYQRIQEQKLWFLTIGKPIEKQHAWVTSDDMKKDGKSEAAIAFELSHRVKELLWTESKTFNPRSKKTWSEEDNLKMKEALEAYATEVKRFGPHDGGIKIDKETRVVKQTTARDADTYNEQAYYLGQHANQKIEAIQDAPAVFAEHANIFERAAARLKKILEERKEKQRALGGEIGREETQWDKAKRQATLAQKVREKKERVFQEKVARGEIDYTSVRAGDIPEVKTKTRAALPVPSAELIARYSSGEKIIFDDDGNEVIPLTSSDVALAPTTPLQPLTKTKTLELKKSSVKKAPTSAETDFDAFTNLLKRPGVDTGRQDNLPHL
jgi:hypothetical protein